MFLGGGHVYVTRSSGIHWCTNAVCGGAGPAGAARLRAPEPPRGIERMIARRGLTDARLLCGGPGRLCQALGITRDHDGLPLDEPPFEIRPREEAVLVAARPRVGITPAPHTHGGLVAGGPRFLTTAFSPSPRTGPGAQA